MNIFLLLIVTVLFILRIKSTPRMLSRKAYLKNIQESIDKNKETFKKFTEKETKLLKEISLVFVSILQIALAIIYMSIGAKVNITYFTILTLFQLLTVIYTSVKQLNMKAFSTDLEDHKFHRWYFLFNVILDYIYYPLAFYLLIK